MQSAPSVVYPVGHSAFYRSLLLVSGGAVGALILVGWLGSWLSTPWGTRHGLWALGVTLWGVWVLKVWGRGAADLGGELHWNASAAPATLGGLPGAWFWRWTDSRRAPVPTKVVLVLDWQRRVLVRTVGLPPAMRWIWLERSACSSRWDDLRRALTAHAETA